MSIRSMFTKGPKQQFPKRSTPHIKLFDAPQMDISASFIRNAVKSGKNIRYFLPAKVWDYIKEMHFYEK